MKETGSPKNDSPEIDLLIVGGGLSGGLLAACLIHRRPEWRIAVVEKEPRMGGNHTWSFHGSDIAPASWAWLRPLVSKSWESHSVAFPAFERTFHSDYHSIRSEDFHERLSSMLAGHLLLSAEAVEIGTREVKLADGRILLARVVIDARGFSLASPGPCGFQKFVGLDLGLSAPHGLKGPILMDARVAQTDGYRFLYVLPWDDKNLLVEDTRYSDSPSLDQEELKSAILAYCLRNGWVVEKVTRTEKGVLPIPLAAQPRPENSVGARANIFQDTTGFTLPDAVRVAEVVAEIPALSPNLLSAALGKYEKSFKPARAFFRALNRMLFLAAAPEERYLVLSKFYRLPESTIQRFYAGRVTWRDIALILSGKPPVPIWRGISAAIASGARSQP